MCILQTRNFKNKLDLVCKIHVGHMMFFYFVTLNNIYIPSKFQVRSQGPGHVPTTDFRGFGLQLDIRDRSVNAIHAFL